MRFKSLLAIFVVCLLAAFALPPPANGQAPGVVISADLQGLSLGPFPILRCQEGLHLFGSNVVKAVPEPLTLVKSVDDLSPLLRQQMTLGKLMQRMDVEFQLTNPANPNQPQRLQHIALFDFIIPEIVLTAGDGIAVEAVKIQYDRACWVGFDESPLVFCWDFKTGKGFTGPADLYK